MFGSREENCISLYKQFYYIKVGYKGGIHYMDMVMPNTSSFIEINVKIRIRMQNFKKAYVNLVLSIFVENYINIRGLFTIVRLSLFSFHTLT